MVKKINHYERLARTMLWSLITFISLLTYVVEIRPFFNSLLGVYFVGLLDGFTTTILTLIAVFYVVSRTRSHFRKRYG